MDAFEDGGDVWTLVCVMVDGAGDGECVSGVVAGGDGAVGVVDGCSCTVVEDAVRTVCVIFDGRP